MMGRAADPCIHIYWHLLRASGGGGGASGSGSNSGNHSRQSSNIDNTGTMFHSNQINTTLDPSSLLKMAPNVVKSRKGSVLARNTILKMDHFSSGKYIFYTAWYNDVHMLGASLLTMCFFILNKKEPIQTSTFTFKAPLISVLRSSTSMVLHSLQ